jgi:WD40 repeat protein
LRRGPRLVLRPFTGGDDDTVEKPLVTLEEKDPIGWHGFNPQGDKVWVLDITEGAGRLRVWSLEPGASPEPRVFAMPKPDGAFSPAWDPTGSHLAWGSSAEKAVWLWDLAGPPDAAPTVLRRPDADLTKQASSVQGDWLVVAEQHADVLVGCQTPGASLGGRHAEGQPASLHAGLPESCPAGDNVRLWPLGPGLGTARRIAADLPGLCLDAALSPDGPQLTLAGNYGAWLAPSIDGKGRWLWDTRVDTGYFFGAVAWDASARHVAVASSFMPSQPNAIVLFDLVTGNRREMSLVPPGETAQGYDWGVLGLAFTPEGRLLAGGSGGLRWIDAATGAFNWIWRLPKEKVVRFALSADGHGLAAASSDAGLGDRTSADWEVVYLDVGRAGRLVIRSHGDGVTAVALDAAGRTLVTGDEQGVVRVGPVDGREPHRLCCHAGKVSTVAVSPDGQWIASASGGEIRLWPMPDVTKPPLHTLPHDALMANLRELTNLQVVEDTASPTGYKLDIGPFPGWKDVPSW